MIIHHNSHYPRIFISHTDILQLSFSELPFINLLPVDHLNMECPDILQAGAETFLLVGGEEFVLERVDAGVEAFLGVVFYCLRVR